MIAALARRGVRQLGGIDPATSIVVLTHDPKLDDAALTIALRSPARLSARWGPGARRSPVASGCSPPG